MVCADHVSILYILLVDLFFMLTLYSEQFIFGIICQLPQYSLTFFQSCRADGSFIPSLTLGRGRVSNTPHV